MEVLTQNTVCQMFRETSVCDSSQSFLSPCALGVSQPIVCLCLCTCVAGEEGITFFFFFFCLFWGSNSWPVPLVPHLQLFCFTCFSDRALHFLPRPDWAADFLPTVSLIYVTTLGFLIEMGLTIFFFSFCSAWSQTEIFPISSSPWAGIIGVSLSTQLTCELEHGPYPVQCPNLRPVTDFSFDRKGKGL